MQLLQFKAQYQYFFAILSGNFCTKFKQFCRKLSQWNYHTCTITELPLAGWGSAAGPLSFVFFMHLLQVLQFLVIILIHCQATFGTNFENK